MTDQFESLFVVMLVAALVPVAIRLLPVAVPQVVLLLLGGILIGPDVLGWADRSELTLFSDVGLGFLFLLAGYELPPLLLRQRAGRLALIGWATSLTLAIGVVAALTSIGYVKTFIPVALALTTTALGTLLPLLRENDMLGGKFGQNMFAAGAVGELGPVLAISLFLSASGSWQSALAIAVVVSTAWLVARIPLWLEGSRVAESVASTAENTTQSVLRWTVTLLLGALVLTADFGLDIVLGAFLAGMVLRQSSGKMPEGQAGLLEKLDSIAYGFFIPIFFVTSGMGLDLTSIIENPGRLAVFFLLLLVVRGLPALLVYRRDLAMAERLQLMLLSATALPLIVAITEVSMANGTMLAENAAALVGAGVLSVAVFPFLALQVRRRANTLRTAATSE